MEIHKPKPVHGWREFLVEIGIIVIGVLIALGAEQTVEGLHERVVSREARQAVKSEINLNIATLEAYLDPKACLDARVQEISSLLDKAERGEPFAAATYIGMPRLATVASQRWTAATASGRTSLLTSDEQYVLSRVYSQFAYLEARQQREEAAWTHLLALESQSRLSPQMILSAREALAVARVEGLGIRINLALAKARAKQIFIAETSPHEISRPAGNLSPLCLPISTSREDASRLIGGGYEPP